MYLTHKLVTNKYYLSNYSDPGSNEIKGYFTPPKAQKLELQT